MGEEIGRDIYTQSKYITDNQNHIGRACIQRINLKSSY